MRSGIIASLVTCVLGVSACEEDDGGDSAGTLPATSGMMSTTMGGEEESEGGESSDPATTATTMPASTTSDPSEGSSSDPGTTTDDPGTEETAASVTVGDESSTGPAGSVCDPDPTGDPCDECTKMKCCPQLETCFEDPVCECMSMCVMGFADFGPCGEMCGMTGTFMQVTDCASSQCLFECL